MQEGFNSKEYIKDLIEMNDERRKEIEKEYKCVLKKRSELWKKLNECSDLQKKEEIQKNLSSYVNLVEFSSEESTYYRHITLYLDLLLKDIPINYYFPYKDYAIRFHKYNLQFLYDCMDFDDDIELEKQKILFELNKLEILDATKTE